MKKRLIHLDIHNIHKYIYRPATHRNNVRHNVTCIRLIEKIVIEGFIQMDFLSLNDEVMIQADTTVTTF